jgi:hypothetical protein
MLTVVCGTLNLLAGGAVDFDLSLCISNIAFANVAVDHSIPFMNILL